MELDKKLHNEIKEYCKLNNLKMIDFINYLVKKAFIIEKYGESPFAPKIEQFQPVVKEKPPKTEHIVVQEVEKCENKAQNDTENVKDDEIRVVEIKPKKRKLSRRHE